MYQPNKNTGSLEKQYMELLPLQFVPPQLQSQLQSQLRELTKHYDRMARIEEGTGEVFIDEKDFRHMLASFKKELPPGFADGYIAQLKSLPDNRLIDSRSHKKKLKEVPWASVAGRVGTLTAPTRLMVPEETEAHIERLRTASTVEQLESGLHALFPSFPDALKQPAGLQARVQQALDSLMGAPSVPAPQGGTVSDLRSIGDIWRCFVSKAGFWATFAAIGALMAIGIALGIIGPVIDVVIAGVVVAVVSGYGAAALIGLGPAAVALLNCIINN
jgi:hypothetical protein